MVILFLAPHPFYQIRGTSIAVNRILKVLSDRGDQVDVVTYHGGIDLRYDHITFYRTPAFGFLDSIPIGFSWRKLVCDLFMVWRILRLVARKRYHLVYSVEEAAFMALMVKKCYGIPYVYDMDSSLPEQIVGKFPLLKPASFVLGLFEKTAVRNAKLIVAVCDALADRVSKHDPERVVTLRDASLLQDGVPFGEGGGKRREDLRGEYASGDIIVMYVGNLGGYKGIDLLLESFRLVVRKTARADLVVIGGEKSELHEFGQMARELGIHRRVHFLGPRPVQDLADYLSQADILVSCRVGGSSTPMKVYSYLHSGKAIVATDVIGHTQVLNSGVAVLVPATAEGLAGGILGLIEDEGLRARLGAAGRRLAEETYSSHMHWKTAHGFFDWLEQEIRRAEYVPATRCKGQSE